MKFLLLAMLLAQKRPTANAAVTVVHTGVPDWPRYTQRADILVKLQIGIGMEIISLVAAGRRIADLVHRPVPPGPSLRL